MAYKGSGYCAQAEFQKKCRQIEIDEEIDRIKQINAATQFTEEELDAFYDDIETRAEVAETGRLEGKMSFILRYKEQNDPEKYKLAKLLAGIPEDF